MSGNDSYAARLGEFCQYSQAHTGGGLVGFVSQLTRLAGGTVDPGPFHEAMERVDARVDCADFAVAALLRFLYLTRQSSRVPRDLLDAVERCVLGFKYWWDEPGDDTMCYHTENHQILFHANELLAGRLFAGALFPNSGQTGGWKAARATPLVQRWLNLRSVLGWSEWLANGYTDHNLLALLNLHDFAPEPAIRDQAGRLADVLLYEVALHSYRGTFGATHGRASSQHIRDSRTESTASICRLALGTGGYGDPDSLGAVALATSGYRPPPVLEHIAADLSRPMTFRERQSFDVEDAAAFGLGFDQIEDGHVYWAMQEFMHPKVLPLTRRICAEYGIGLDRDWRDYDREYRRQEEQYGRIIDPLRDCHALSEVRIQTYRTDAGMLSSAQDYRPGRPGYQQHIWQATLGPDAVVFTSHPGSGDDDGRPNFWAGNGVLPRARQVDNVLVCLHKVPADDPFSFSHAYFPRAAFDRVHEDGQWVLAQKGAGYLALHSGQPWQRHGDSELRVAKPENAWVCELGRAAEWGSFENFARAVTASRIDCDGLSVRYDSPSRGVVSLDWTGPLSVNGNEVVTTGRYRFDNPYTRSPLGERRIRIATAEQTLDLGVGYPA
jgi:hypothetical protein